MARMKAEGLVGTGNCAHCHAQSESLSRVTYEVTTHLCPSCALGVIGRTDAELLKLVTRAGHGGASAGPPLPGGD